MGFNSGFKGLRIKDITLLTPAIKPPFLSYIVHTEHWKKYSGRQKHQAMGSRNWENYNLAIRWVGVEWRVLGRRQIIICWHLKKIVCRNNHINGKEIGIKVFKLDSETNDGTNSNSYANGEDENKSVTLTSSEGKVVKKLVHFQRDLLPAFLW